MKLWKIIQFSSPKHRRENILDHQKKLIHE